MIRTHAPDYLAMGASLTIGLLSFGGILALSPSLPLAFAAVALSVAYEGEIYSQNIKRAWKKIFKSNHLKRQLAKEYLLETLSPFFQNNDNLQTIPNNMPQFFKDYISSLRQPKPNKKQLGDMEKWFAEQLFAEDDQTTLLTAYQKKLRHFLATVQADWRQKLVARRLSFQWVQVLSVVAGAFMGLGTSYLLVDAFLTIPWFAAMPVMAMPLLIVPMSILAGIAYGFLIYNATTDMMATDTISRCLRKVFDDINKGNWLMPIILGTMLSISVVLSLCTAGTWWTVAKTTRPLFTWMRQMPSFIMQVLNPFISSVSIFIFNIQNVVETLEMVEEAFSEKPAQSIAEPEVQDEHFLQRMNIFRGLIFLTFLPLRFVLFIGHLVSIGVTADRVPGVSPTVSAVIGILNEGVEDGHYFFGELGHEHKYDTLSLLNDRLGLDAGHNHNDDLPTKCLKFVFHILYIPAAIWDSFFSRWHEDETKFIDFWTALDKVRGIKTACTHEPRPNNLAFCELSTPPVSSAWSREQAIFRIERYQQKKTHLVTENDSLGLNDIKQQLRNNKSKLSVQSLINRKNGCGFFSEQTCSFLKDLPARVASSTSYMH